MFPWYLLIFLKRSLVFPILLFSSISLHWSLRKGFLSLLAILWNSAFKWVYLSFSPLPFTSLLFTAICKTSSDNHFAFLFYLWDNRLNELIKSSCFLLPQYIMYEDRFSLFWSISIFYIDSMWWPMSSMNLDIQISPQIWEVLSHYCLKEAFCTLFLLFSFWNSNDSQIGLLYIILYITQAFFTF